MPHANNKDADQPAHLHSLISVVVSLSYIGYVRDSASGTIGNFAIGTPLVLVTKNPEQYQQPMVLMVLMVMVMQEIKLINIIDITVKQQQQKTHSGT